MLGKHHSETSKKKISGAAKGRDMSKAIEASSRNRKKPVVQMLNGLIINTFDSAKEAAEYMNTSRANISSCASGKRKTVKGYNWKFKEEMEVVYDHS